MGNKCYWTLVTGAQVDRQVPLSLPRDLPARPPPSKGSSGDNELHPHTSTHTTAMKTSILPWLLAALPAIASASAAVGQVFLYDAEAVRPTTAETVDPATARLILAQRLGLSQFHSIADAGDAAIRQVNSYGGQSQELFGWGGHEESKARVMIVVEGIRDPLSMYIRHCNGRGSMPMLTHMNSTSPCIDRVQLVLRVSRPPPLR
jgi:hypothetical protein